MCGKEIKIHLLTIFFFPGFMGFGAVAYWCRPATVIYPPVEVLPDDGRKGGGDDLFSGDYFLSTARLEPLKRVEVIVRAFRALPEVILVVTSGGSQLEYLKRLAGDAPNIRFTGWVADHMLGRLLHRCLATVYIARDEDFGMSPVESMAGGKPVIGAGEGGLLETVIDGETGMLLPVSTGDTLTQAIQAMTPARARAMAPACLKQAAKFSRQRFLDQFTSLLPEDLIDLKAFSRVPPVDSFCCIDDQIYLGE